MNCAFLDTDITNCKLNGIQKFPTKNRLFFSYCYLYFFCCASSVSSIHSFKCCETINCSFFENINNVLGAFKKYSGFTSYASFWETILHS